MIDWMQKHRKYLLITIWISTIAFIGAGSTGWGGYDFARSSDVIASVGEEDIRYNELKSEYNRIFLGIKQKNPRFNEENAKAIKLQQRAMDNVITRKYLLNYAKDINLIATEDEILKAITENKSFFVGDQFSKDYYKSVLKQNNITPTIFEEQVSNGIIIEKVLNIFKANLSPLEQRLSDINTKLEENIEIKVFDSSKAKVRISKKALKDFWEKTKNRYMTNTQYVLDAIEVRF